MERSDFECNRVGAVYIAGVSTEFVEMYFPNEKKAFFFYRNDELLLVFYGYDGIDEKTNLS